MLHTVLYFIITKTTTIWYKLARLLSCALRIVNHTDNFFNENIFTCITLEFLQVVVKES